MTEQSMTRIVYSSGDPSGIGLDIILQAAQHVQQQAFDDLVVLACPDVLLARAKQLNLTINIVEADYSGVLPSQSLRVQPIALDVPIQAGEPNKLASQYVLAMLDHAIAGCQQGRYQAMVTGPLNKAMINDSGVAFSGHTEYLAEKTAAPLPVMMLATEGLRVALMTTHLPLRDVADAIDQDLIKAICRTVWHDLQNKFGIKQPKILLCGLNPHAGENGYLGREEIDIVQPALSDLRAEGIVVQGPLPADTLFQPRYLDDTDVVIAMYHDQGLPVLKFKGFGQSANITLGLPIVRTSVDHGTAYDLAGTGKADVGSLLTAINVAKQMVQA